ncbi:unnamed protein product, partial [Meganyctiphanes norvegica]
RLDYDCKKRKKDNGGSNVTEEDMKLAEEKFAESWHLAQLGMHNLLEEDVEQVSQLALFANNILEYHKQCEKIIEALLGKLDNKKNAAAMKPKKKFVPQSLSVCGIMDTLNRDVALNIPASTLPSSMKISSSSPSTDTPLAIVINDYEPENAGELGLKEGETVILTKQIGKTWFEGICNETKGWFPCNYVKVIVPLPS